MTTRDLLLAELNREVERSRRALNQAPKGKYDWKPHEKSMVFGYLANMVATIPTWVAMQINQDELDVAPVDGGQMKQERLDGSEDLLKALDKAAETARAGARAQGAARRSADRRSRIDAGRRHPAQHQACAVAGDLARIPRTAPARGLLFRAAGSRKRRGTRGLNRAT